MTYTPFPGDVGTLPGLGNSAPSPLAGEGRGEGGPSGAAGSQQTIATQRAALDRPSIASRIDRQSIHATQQAQRGESVFAANKARSEAMSIVAGGLADFIHQLGVGAEFQGVDFTTRMYQLKLWPDTSVFDRRATGAMYKRLMTRGVIEIVGYRPDGGCKHTDHNSSVRPVFKILRTTNRAEVLGPSFGSTTKP
jgi:hypothetical protein